MFGLRTFPTASLALGGGGGGSFQINIWHGRLASISDDLNNST